jgi:hypothetical protein
LKGQLKTSSNIATSNTLVGAPKENKFELRRPSIDRKNKISMIPTRTEAKSAQKTSAKEPACPKCPKLEEEVKELN